MKAKRRNLVRGRIRNQEAVGRKWTFELRRDVHDKKSGALQSPGGLWVHERNKKLAAGVLVGFSELVNPHATTCTVRGMDYTVRVAIDGVEVRQKGFKKWRLIPWAELIKEPRRDAPVEQFELIKT